MPEAVIGLDVGKSSHWACVATRDGEVLLSAPVANREDDLDSLFGRFPDALVVVDQSRNIGALALARARAAGMSAWIGNTYLDDSGRDSPASLNSTGDMWPGVEWILKLSYRCA